MKKPILILLISLAFACNQSKVETAEVRIPDVNSTTIATNDKLECVDKIIINRSLVDHNWIIANANVICDTTATPLVVDLYRIANPTGTERAGWLKENGDKIDFKLSEDHILSAHILSEPRTAPKFYPIKLKAIKDKVGLDTYTSDKYGHYIEFSIVSDKLVLNIAKNYNPQATSYSIPLFRTLESKKGYNGDTELKFGVYEGKLFFNGGGSGYNISSNPKHLGL